MYRPVLAQGPWQKHGRQHPLVVKWHTAPSDCGLWAALSLKPTLCWPPPQPAVPHRHILYTKDSMSQTAQISPLLKPSIAAAEPEAIP